MRAVLPGEVLRLEYLASLSLSVNALAVALGGTGHKHP
jgi:plasmid maintenance system antidote protein VapI